MSWSLVIFTLLNVWWVMLFFMLPFAVDNSSPREAHHYAAAPRRVRWKRTLLLNTVLSVAVTGLLAWMIHARVIPMHDML